MCLCNVKVSSNQQLQIDPKEFDFNRYTSNSSKSCTLEVDVEYQKKLHELHNNYP